MAFADALRVDRGWAVLPVPSVQDVHRRQGRKLRMDDRETLIRRLMAGEWLNPGEVAVILKVNRRTVHNMMEQGKRGQRIRTAFTGGGRLRVCNPEDVQQRLAAMPPEV